MLILLCLVQVYSDPMYYIDYKKNLEYSWEFLQEQGPYVIDQPDYYVKFNFGEDLQETCQGQEGSVIQFWKNSDKCEILGKHSKTSMLAFKNFDNPAIKVVYSGGSLCRNRFWGDVLRKTEFKFHCSEEEKEFVLFIGASSCSSIIEKYSKAGCPKSVVDGIYVKGVLFL